MGFLIRSREEKKYVGYYPRRHSRRNRYLRRILKRSLMILAIAYCLSLIFLYFRQNNIVYRPESNISISNFGNRSLKLNPQNVKISVPNSQTTIRGWWLDAPSRQQPVVAIKGEPVNILTTPKTMLYFSGTGGKTAYSDNLARIQAFGQLGFSVLTVDYWDNGKRKPRLADESRLYQNAEAAWQYLTDTKQISPQDIIICGESLGGAVAMDLAVKQPNAAGLIVQSSFTSMVDRIKQLHPPLKIFPLELIIRQRFDSIDKVSSLKMPVLFLHGTADSIVDYKMSRELYYVAPEPKSLFYIPKGEHQRIYQPGTDSYLLAIEEFVSQLDSSSND